MITDLLQFIIVIIIAIYTDL